MGILAGGLVVASAGAPTAAPTSSSISVDKVPSVLQEEAATHFSATFCLDGDIGSPEVAAVTDFATWSKLEPNRAASVAALDPQTQVYALYYANVKCEIRGGGEIVGARVIVAGDGTVLGSTGWGQPTADMPAPSPTDPLFGGNWDKS
jgi:hypothetical protein